MGDGLGGLVATGLFDRLFKIIVVAALVAVVIGYLIGRGQQEQAKHAAPKKAAAELRKK